MPTLIRYSKDDNSVGKLRNKNIENIELQTHTAWDVSKNNATDKLEL